MGDQSGNQKLGLVYVATVLEQANLGNEEWPTNHLSELTLDRGRQRLTLLCAWCGGWGRERMKDNPASGEKERHFCKSCYGRHNNERDLCV
jgi:hypothetical protein